MKIPEEILPESTFTCGPSQGHPGIKKTQLADIPFERSHRSEDITKNGLIKDATENVRKLLKLDEEHAVIFFLGGATAALDALAWNLTTDSISGLRFGAFSNLWGKKICKALDPNIKQSFVDCEEGEIFPSKEPDYNASLLLLTPNETSTGVAIPDEYLKAAYEKASPKTLVAWDCTSCTGGRSLPKGCWDAMVFSLQKCFGCAGGTSILILNKKALQRQKEVIADRRVPYSLDLTEAVVRAVEKYQTVNTPSTLTIWMFNEACKWMLANGGEDGMAALVKKHAQAIWDWTEKNSYASPYITDEKYRSQTTVTLKIDADTINVDVINKQLKATGLANLADGIKKYSSVKENVLRIACFPFVDINGTNEIEKLLKCVDYIIDNH